MTGAEFKQSLYDMLVSNGYVNGTASLSDVFGSYDWQTAPAAGVIFIVRHKSGRWCPVIYTSSDPDHFDGSVGSLIITDEFDHPSTEAIEVTWSVPMDSTITGLYFKQNQIWSPDDGNPPYGAHIKGDSSFANGEQYTGQSYYSNHPITFRYWSSGALYDDYTLTDWTGDGGSNVSDGHLFTGDPISWPGDTPYFKFEYVRESTYGVFRDTIFNNDWSSTPVKGDFSVLQLGVIKGADPYNPPGPTPPGPTPGGGMELKLWKNFKKRRNSTKTPTGGTTYTVILKKDTSILAPHFVMSDPEINYNYCKFNDRYYYIEDTISLANGLIELVCEVDPLASGKSDILGATQYVERSASVYDDMIDDTLTVIKQESTKNTTRVPMMLDQTHFMFSQGGYYVLSVVNGKGSGSGFNCYYIIDGVTLQKIANYVNQKWGAGASDLNDFFQANFLKTADSIGTCIWLPLSLMTLEDELVDGVDISYEQLQIGTDDMDYGGQPIKGYRILKPSCLITGTWYIDIPHVYTDFRKAKPYTVCEMYLPFVGNVDINPLDFDNDRIYIDYNVDVCTGDAFVTLCSGGNYAAGDCIVYKNGNIAVNMPTGKSGTDVGGVSSGLFTMGAGIAAIASVMAAPPVAAGLTAAQTATLAGGSVAGLTGLSKAVSAGTKSQSSLSGDGGGRAATHNGLSLNCTVIAYDTSDPTDANFIALNGRPLQKAMSLSSLTGYVKCGNVNVPTALTESEKERIDGSLNAGLYIE